MWVERYDPSDIVNEGSTKKRGRSELRETSTECTWNRDPVLPEHANKYKHNLVSSETLINEIMAFNHVPENVKKGKTLDTYLRELLAEQDKYIRLDQDKTLSLSTSLEILCNKELLLCVDPSQKFMLKWRLKKYLTLQMRGILTPC